MHISETVKTLTERGVTLVSTDGIDSSTPVVRMMIGVLGSLVEYERELVKARTALKRQASRVNDVKFGRPKKVADANHIVTARRMKADGNTARDIAKYLGSAARLCIGTWPTRQLRARMISLKTSCLMRPRTSE